MSARAVLFAVSASLSLAGCITYPDIDMSDVQDKASAEKARAACITDAARHINDESWGDAFAVVGSPVVSASVGAAVGAASGAAIGAALGASPGVIAGNGAVWGAVDGMIDAPPRLPPMGRQQKADAYTRRCLVTKGYKIAAPEE